VVAGSAGDAGARHPAGAAARLVFFGLAPIPAWRAEGCAVRVLERALVYVAA